MSGLLVDLPFGFDLNGRRRRGRTFVNMWANDTILVELPEVSGLELVADVWVNGDKRNDHARIFHDGKDFLCPVGLRTKKMKSSISDEGWVLPTSAMADLAEGDRGLLFGEWIKWPTIPMDQPTIKGVSIKEEGENWNTPYAVDYRFDDRVAEVAFDDRGEALLKASAIAARMVVFDGEILIKAPEPVLLSSDLDEDRPLAEAFVYLGWSGKSYSGEFRLPASALPAVERKGYRHVVHRPDLFRFDPWAGNVDYVLDQAHQLLEPYNRTGEDRIAATRRNCSIALACMDFLEGRAEDPGVVYSLIEDVREQGTDAYAEVKLSALKRLLTSIDDTNVQHMELGR